VLARAGAHFRIPRLDEGLSVAHAIINETGEILEVTDRGLALPGRVSQIGLELPESLSFEEWQGIGETLKGVERSLMWWIGDWLRYGERRYGETYSQALDATDYSCGALMNAKSVAKRFETSRRRENLSWSHHAEVAALEKQEADALLDEAVRDGLSMRALRARVSQRKAARAILGAPTDNDTCSAADLFRLASSGAKFGTIYADPPWRYDNQTTRAATGNHYAGMKDDDGREVQSAAGMTIDEICALPVRELAADDAHLHMWTTNGFIFECPKIFEAWGFEFRSSLVWVKPQIGIGNYWRNSHEFLLTAVRGDAKRFNDHSLRSWIECDRGAHSAKPEKVRHFIERASPGPYLELFGRSLAPKWVVWGNQIQKTIFDTAVRDVG
jgi:N6-adenosine-specific RNA methylase IME4